MAVQPKNTANNSDNDIDEDVPLSELAKANSTTETTPSKKLDLAITRKLVIYAFFTMFVMITTTIALIFVSLNMTADKTNIPEEYPSLITTHVMFTRGTWKASPPLNFTQPLHHPTEYVLISHTAGKFCNNFTECAPILQSIQSEQMAKLKTPDIGYNFLIGGDGNIYVGQGWDFRNFHADNNIGISFIGNFVFDSLTPRMVAALKELLAFGVHLNKLPADYKLVCHNQTYATSSPGENVFKAIKILPHYLPGRVEIPT